MTSTSFSARTILPTATRRSMAPLAIGIAIVLAICAFAIVTLQGPGAIGFPTKALAAGALFAGAASLALRRPALFPLLVFIAAIPFDTMLQTGGGTITKFLGFATVGMTVLLLTDRRRTVTPPVAVAGWGAFLTWSVASFMWSPDPAFGAPILMQVAELFFLFVIFSMLRMRGSEIRWVVIVTLLSGVACSLYGVYMYFSGHIAHEDAVSQRLSIDLSRGTYINADHFAGALVFPMALALVGFLRLQSWRKALAGVAFLALFAGVLVSATRGSLIALLVMGVYLAVVERKRLQLLITGAFGLLLSLGIPSIWTRFTDPEQGGMGGRSGIWSVAWLAFKSHWLVGFGTGDFRLAYGTTYLQVYQRGPIHAWAEDSHNLIASTGVELGVIGLALILGAWFLQYRIVSNIPRGTSLGALRSAVEAGTIGLFIVALTVDVMWYKYIWLAFIVGVLTRNAWIHDRDIGLNA